MSSLKKEIVRFLRQFHFIRLGKRTVALGRSIPFLFEIKNFRKLYRKKKFFISRDILRDYALLKRTGYVPSIQLRQKLLTSSPALSLHVAHTCNLTCDYCFVKEGMRQGHVKLMSPDTAQKAVNFFYQSIVPKKNQIIFVGGEPLLNMPAIKAAIQEVRKHPGHKTKLSIVTNGTLLDREKASFLNRNKVRLCISYDGIQEEHDRKRHFKDGGKTSRKILDNIIMLNQMGIEVAAIKATIARDSAYSMLDFAKSFHKIPVHPSKMRLTYEFSYPAEGLKNRTISEMKEFYDDILKNAKRRKKILEEFSLNGDEGFLYKLCFPKQQSEEGCGFSKNKVLVTPDGNFYFCDLLVNKEEFHIGSLWEGVDHVRLARLRKFFRMDTEKCKNCFARSICTQCCPLINVNKRVIAERCKINKHQCKTMLEVYLRLKPEDLRSLYKHSSLPEEKKAPMEKAMAVGWGLRNALQQNTSELKPLNLLPFAD